MNASPNGALLAFGLTLPLSILAAWYTHRATGSGWLAFAAFLAAGAVMGALFRLLGGTLGLGGPIRELSLAAGGQP